MSSDYICICLRCGSVIDKPSEMAIKMMGRKILKCCKNKMVEISIDEIHLVYKGLENAKVELENKAKEILDL